MADEECLIKKGSRFTPAFYRALAVACFSANGAFSAVWMLFARTSSIISLDAPLS